MAVLRLGQAFSPLGFAGGWVPGRAREYPLLPRLLCFGPLVLGETLVFVDSALGIRVEELGCAAFGAFGGAGH